LETTIEDIAVNPHKAGEVRVAVKANFICKLLK